MERASKPLTPQSNKRQTVGKFMEKEKDTLSTPATKSTSTAVSRTTTKIESPFVPVDLEKVVSVNT